MEKIKDKNLINKHIARINQVYQGSRKRAYNAFIELIEKIDDSKLIYTPLARLTNEFVAQHDFYAHFEKYSNKDSIRYHEVKAIYVSKNLYDIRHHCLEVLRRSNFDLSNVNSRIRNELIATSFNLIGCDEFSFSMPYEIDRNYNFKKVLIFAEMGADLNLLLNNIPGKYEVTLVVNDKDLSDKKLIADLKRKFKSVTIKNNTLGDFESYSKEDIKICKDAKNLSTEIVSDILKMMKKTGVDRNFFKYKEDIAIRLEDRMYPSLRNSFSTKDSLKGDFDAYFVVHSNNFVFQEILDFFKKTSKPVFCCSSARSGSSRSHYIEILEKQNELTMFKLYNTMIKDYKVIDLKSYKLGRKEDANPPAQNSDKKDSILIVSTTSHRYQNASFELIRESAKENRTYNLLINSSTAAREIFLSAYNSLDEKLLSNITNVFEEYTYDIKKLKSEEVSWSLSIFDKYLQKLVKKKIKKKYNLIFVTPTYAVIEQFIIREFPTFLTYHYFLDDLFNTRKFEFLISIPGRDPKISIAIKKARERGIKSLDIQAFFLSNHPRYKASIADKMCVIDSEARDLYLNHFKLPAERIFMAGSIPIDINVQKLKKYKKSETKKHLGIDRNKRIITFATQPWNYEIFEETFKVILKTYNNNDNIQILFKFHPQDGALFEQKMRALATESEANVVFNRESDIFEVIRVSDGFITIFSNVGLEASISGLPVISANITNNKLPISLGDKGVAVEAKNPGDFKKYLLMLETKEGANQILAKHGKYREENPQMFSLDSAKRIIELGFEISKD
jgi:glycosyltransferase involved in cell wall biosynthesis